VLQLLAQRLRKVRHRIEIVDTALVNPLEELAGAKRLLALRDQPFGQPRQGEIEQIGFSFHLPPSALTWRTPGAAERNRRFRRARFPRRPIRARRSHRSTARSRRGSCPRRLSSGRWPP